MGIKYAGFSVDGGIVSGDITNRSIFDFAGESLLSKVENTGVFYLFNGYIQSEFKNLGQLSIANAEGPNPLNLENLNIINEGMISKDGSTPLEVKSLTNSGNLEILDGKLSVLDSVELISGTIYLEEDTELQFNPGQETPLLIRNGKFRGKGTVSISSSDKNIVGIKGVENEVRSISSNSGITLNIENTTLENVLFEQMTEGKSTTYLNEFFLNNTEWKIGSENILILGNVASVSVPTMSPYVDFLSVQDAGFLHQGTGESILNVSSIFNAGEIQVSDIGTLNINTRGSDFFFNAFKPIANLPTLELSNGKWIVNKGGSLNLSHDQSIKDITSIGKSAKLIIGGGAGGSSPNFNGEASIGFGLGQTSIEDFLAQPDPKKSESFQLKGHLTIDNTSFTVLGMHYNSTDVFKLGPYATISADENGTVELCNEAVLTLEYGKVPYTEHGTLNGGNLIGIGILNGNRINSESTKPGKSPGRLIINGYFEQTQTGILEIELFGTEPGTEYDQLVVNGTATLGGTLHVIPATEITESSSFEPLLASSVVGDFDRVIVETSSGRNTYTVTPVSTGIQISPATLEVTTFTDFRDALFSETDIADDTIGLTTSDPDGDQFSNLLEYAMDLNPWVTNKNPTIVEFEPAATEGFGRVKVKFPWAKDMTDVDYVIQISPDMTVWSDLSSTVEDTIDEGTHELLTVAAEIDPPANERLFVRVLVTQQEL
ncbi:MAG: hypothetical protein O3C20_23785 [Verrucomicrobia bacterium]|nr:hypothetical protein [Verrucomicrobiota bacterium]